MRTRVANRTWPLAPEEAQACSLGRMGMGGVKLSSVMKLKNQTSPGPERKGNIQDSVQ